MDEIVGVEEIHPDTIKISKDTRDNMGFKITTIPEGYNSGRAYYLDTSSQPNHSQILANLQKFVQIARKKAERKSLVKKYQERIRVLFESIPFQTSSAVLIFAVSF